MLLASVISSAYSSSPPKAIPLAMVVILQGNCSIFSEYNRWWYPPEYWDLGQNQFFYPFIFNALYQGFNIELVWTNPI